MKITLINIDKNPAYAEQYATLKHLEKSLGAAQSEVERVSATLNAWSIPRGLDAVSHALSVIDGSAPERQSMEIANMERAAAERKTVIIKQAIIEQHAVLNTLTSTLSRGVVVSRRGEHVEAVKAVANALKALDAALESEWVIRESIMLAGYRCSFPVFVFPEIGRLNQPQSLMDIRYREANNYAIDYEDDISGKLDKPVTVRLLMDVSGVGNVGDVISMDGRPARVHVRRGSSEETTDKLQRVAKFKGNYQEAVFS